MNQPPSAEMANAYPPGTILIASDNASDTAQVKRLLELEFSHVYASVDPDMAVVDFEQCQPDVLMLAFHTLEKAERCYLGILRLSDAAHLKPHRSVVLCSKDELRHAYKLCCDGFFDDYVLFWPMTHDTLRLPMAVHQALRELATWAEIDPMPVDFAVQARNLATLDKVLEQKMAQGRQFIEDADHAAGKAVSDIGATLDNFFRKWAQGALPDDPELKDAESLTREMARIQQEEVRQRLEAVAESVRPLRHWAEEFRQECAPHLESARSLSALADRSPPSILVVDDDEFQRKIVGTILKDCPYRLEFASSGVDALHKLRNQHPNLILLDVMMPDIDGLTVLRHLRNMPRLVDIPVIIITGNSEKDIVINSLKLGISDFLVKPFDRDTLRSKVAQLLNRI